MCCFSHQPVATSTHEAWAQLVAYRENKVNICEEPKGITADSFYRRQRLYQSICFSGPSWRLGALKVSRALREDPRQRGHSNVPSCHPFLCSYSRTHARLEHDKGSWVAVDLCVRLARLSQLMGLHICALTSASLLHVLTYMSSGIALPGEMGGTRCSPTSLEPVQPFRYESQTQ